MGLETSVVEKLPSVEGELHYLVPMAERPRNYAFDPPPGVARSNTSHEPHRLPIRDLRPIAPTISLDAVGFDLVEHRSAVRDFHDEDEIRRVYYSEAVRLLKDVTGAQRIHIFDHTLRRRIPGAEDRRDPGARQPARRVHVDHTARSGPQRVRDFFPDEAEELLRGRVQIINLWRPLHGPLRDAPLAVCEAGSINDEDLVPSDLVYPNRTGETYGVTYDPAHRWFYVPQMLPSEALLLKCFDSKTDGRARFTPHTSFLDPTAPQDAPLRESIELRTLVFHRA
jgi:hypothetical protein